VETGFPKRSCSNKALENGLAGTRNRSGQSVINPRERNLIDRRLEA